MTIESVRFKKSGKNVVMEGKAAGGADVVVENKSLAPFAPTDTPDVFARVKAGADGSFSVVVPAGREGDRLQVKAGHSVLGVRLANVEATDGRPPVVRQQGLRIVDDGHGAYQFVHCCKSTVVGEPGQLLQMKNVRTSEAVVFTLDEHGNLPKDARVTGEPGDTFQLSTTDGAHNTRFVDGCGRLIIPPKKGTEPAQSSQTSAVKLAHVDGPLFAANGPRGGQAKQGEMGDCWLVATADAVAAFAPQRLREMMKENADGTVTVTFKRYDHAAKQYVDEPVTVTRQLYVKSQGGGPLAFGASTDKDLWFPLLEKAYAQWKGGYDGARSGYPYEAFEAILGAEGRHFDLDVTSADGAWAALSARAKRGEAMVAWTRLDSPELRFANSGLAQDHAYTILGVVERNGRRFVELRNPWGSNAYGPHAAALGITLGDNGKVSMTIEAFLARFIGFGAAPTGASGASGASPPPRV